MKVFASIVRFVLLTASMILFLLICITRIGSASEKGAFLYGVTLLTWIAYLAFSALCLLLGWLMGLKRDENVRMQDKLLGTVATLRNNACIRLFHELSFWGCLVLIIALFILHVPFGLIYGGPYETDLILKTWHGFLLWSAVIFPVSLVLKVLYFAFYLPHYGDNTYTVFDLLVKTLGSDITAPIDNVRAVFQREGKIRISNIISLIVMILFILLNAAGVLKTIL